MQFPHQFCVSRKQKQQSEFLDLCEGKKYLIDFLINELKPLVFEKSSFLQEISDLSQSLGVSVPKVCAAITFSKNVIIEPISAVGNLLIATEIAETDKVIFQKPNLLIQTAHTNMHFLTISRHQVSVLRNQAKYWTIR